MKNTMYTNMIANIGVYQKYLAKINGLPKSTDCQFEGIPKTDCQFEGIPKIRLCHYDGIPKTSVYPKRVYS